MRVMHVDAMAWLAPRLGQITTQDERKHVSKTQLSSEWTAHVDGLVKKLAPKVQPAFTAMSTAVAKQSAAAMRSIGLDVRGQLGPQIEMFREWNVSLMTNAGREYAGQVAEILDDPENYGLTVEALTRLITDRADVSEAHAELIARDQSSKLNGAINQHRQQNAGVSSYTWSGSLDERERETHLANEGQTFDWNDPPAETGHPTEDVQCRCVAIPVIPELDDEA